MNNRATTFSLSAAFLFFFLLAALPSNAENGSITEQDVKAAFVFNFAKFVEWPFSVEADSFVVGLLGEDPIGPKLDKLLMGKEVRGKKIVIHRFSGVSSLESCHILFVSRSFSKDLSAVRSALREKEVAGVLMVGDSPGFAKSGGVVGFFMEEGKVRFEINPKAAEQEKLKISSQLLKLARIVE